MHNHIQTENVNVMQKTLVILSLFVHCIISFPVLSDKIKCNILRNEMEIFKRQNLTYNNVNVNTCMPKFNYMFSRLLFNLHIQRRYQVGDCHGVANNT